MMCEHCQTPVGNNEKRAVLNGCSYHERCRKCYVCSETNLRDAEVFKGVIFCSSCSQRIFQGCSTAKRTKDTAKRTKDRSHKQRSYRTKEMWRKPHDGILAMAGQAASSDTSRSCSLGSKHSEPPAMSAEMVLPDANSICSKNKNVKKSSAEMGMTTDVTQKLLTELDCPVVHHLKEIKNKTRPALTLSPFKKFQKNQCSDLRVAELGTSREIANMALRHKSELPVIIVPERKVMTSQSESQNRETESDNEEWIDSAYGTSKNSTKSRWKDRRLSSLLKLPYYNFKKNILDKNSAISVLMKSENKLPLKERLKRAINQEIAGHQRRGVKRLYSTLNRKQIPHRLGWAHLVANAHANNDKSVCKHLKASHSYRCMRAQAMKLAGPTRSELAVIRKKMKTMMSPVLIRKLGMNYNKYPAIARSNGCGSSNAEPSRVKLKIA